MSNFNERFRTLAHTCLYRRSDLAGHCRRSDLTPSVGPRPFGRTSPLQRRSDLAAQNSRRWTQQRFVGGHSNAAVDEPSATEPRKSPSGGPWVVPRAFLLLRVAWTLWLASFLVLFAVPIIVLDLVNESSGDPWIRLVSAKEPWTWDTELWVPTLLALVIPALGHTLMHRRTGSPFALAQRADLVMNYRSAQPWVVTTSPRVVRRLVGLYAVRLGLAMALSALPFSVLTATRYVEPFGCMSYRYVRSVPEHLAFTLMLFIVAAFHMPTRRRLLGKRPSVKTCVARASCG